MWHLAGHALPSIRALSIPDSEVADEDLSLLPEWKTLAVFEFPTGMITDGGVAHLKKFSSLKKLVLSDSKITDAGLVELLHLKKLEVVTLNNFKNVTNRGMKILATMPVLNRLLLENSSVTGEGLVHLAPSRSLRYVGIGVTQASKAARTSQQNAFDLIVGKRANHRIEAGGFVMEELSTECPFCGNTTPPTPIAAIKERDDDGREFQRVQCSLCHVHNKIYAAEETEGRQIGTDPISDDLAGQGQEPLTTGEPNAIRETTPK